jgi:hypothetical protein
VILLVSHLDYDYVHVMIEAPHPVHTHRRSCSYIYNAFQHLLLQPVVIRMQTQCDIAVGDSLGVSWDRAVSYD